MALPGLLIEYLLTGVLALVWVWPLLVLLGFDAARLWPDGAVAVVVLVPVAHVLGMLVDTLARALCRGVGHWPDRGLERLGLRSLSGYPISLRTNESWPDMPSLMILCPDMAVEYRQLSSRDRVARGALFNAGALLLVQGAALGPGQSALPFGWNTILLNVAALVLLYWTWRRFEFLSERFRTRAAAALTRYGKAAPPS